MHAPSVDVVLERDSSRERTALNDVNDKLARATGCGKEVGSKSTTR